MSRVIETVLGVLEIIIRYIFEKILRVQITDERMGTILQFLQFCIVGLSNTVISYVIYVVCLLLFQHFVILVDVDYLVAQLIAFVLSVLWSFYWNNKYVFRAEEGRSIWKTLLKTYVSYAFTGLFLNSILSIFWVEMLKIPKIYAPIINLLVSVPINYIMNKFWAFGRGDK